MSTTTSTIKPPLDPSNPSDHAKMMSHFNTIATSYEKTTRGLTRNVATHFLRTLSPPITSSSTIHDNASGPGIVTFEILRGFTPSRILATDIAPGMIDALKSNIPLHLPDSPTKQKLIEPHVRDAQDLQFPDAIFTHSLTCFGIFACPDPALAAREIHRTLRPGGVAVVTTWKYPGTMDMIHRISEYIRPGKPVWSPVSTDWYRAEKLPDTLVAGGFEREKLEVSTYGQVMPADEEGEMGRDRTEEIVEIFRGEFFEMARQGWSEGEVGRWEEGVRAVLREEERREGVGMVAWVAVARK
ncbi:MAG: hypothetical protein Q9227_000152 [Pyrenula ochraceoflavens]